MGRRLTNYERIEDSTFELNLAPMLDMLTVLITVLLVSFQSIRLGLLDGLIPQPVMKALENDRKKLDREVQIAVKIDPKTGFQIEVTETGKKLRSIQVSNIENKWDLEKFHKELVQLKLLKTDNFRIEFLPSEEASFDDLVKAMDRARYTVNGDPKIEILDEATGQRVETTLLFPDIVFTNAVEG